MKQVAHAIALWINKALLILILSFLSAVPFVSIAQFTQGNLVVLQIGDGSSAMAGTGNALVVNEYNTSGTATYSMAIPSTGTNALVLRGNASSEGYMSLSTDGYHIIFGAYAKALPNVTTLNSVAASTINRGIGIISGAGSYSLAAIAASPYANGDIRGATATNSLNLWSAGSSQGLAYFGTSAAAGLVENTKTNLRATHIFNNQLYISSQVNTGTPPDIGIYSVGTGTPLSASQTVSTVINTGTGSQPGQFYFNAANTICYVADARNNGGGGVQKWVYASPVWTLAYTLPTGTTSAGAFGVVADFSGADPLVYATSTEASNNRLVAIKDVGVNSTATTLATAQTANTIFRGLCFSPGICLAPSGISCTYNSPACSNQALTFTTSASGSSPMNYSWSGLGVFSSTAVSSPSVTNAVSGNYSLQLSNSCGTASTVISVTVFPSPTLQVNAATICSGGVATLTASGANSYSWNTGNTTSSFTASPASSTTYTLNGFSAQGCAANQVTTAITLTTAAAISVNSATMCAGASVTLSASGASSYTWSTNSNNSAIVVSPLSNSTYTVSGYASGCPNSASASANVVVNPLPSVSLTVSQTLVCVSSPSLVLNGLPQGGIYSGTGVSGNGFAPVVAGTGSHSLTYQYSNTNGCTNTASLGLLVDPCTAVGRSFSDEIIKIFPNPSAGVFQLQLSSEVNISLQNSLGQTLMETKLHKGLHLLDLTCFENGMYFLEVVNMFKSRSRIQLIKVTN